MLKTFVYHNILVKTTRSTRTQYLRGQNALILGKEKPMQKKLLFNCFIKTRLLLNPENDKRKGRLTYPTIFTPLAIK